MKRLEKITVSPVETAILPHRKRLFLFHRKSILPVSPENNLFWVEIVQKSVQTVGFISKSSYIKSRRKM